MVLEFIITHTPAGVFQQALVMVGLHFHSTLTQVIGDLVATVTVIVMAIIMAIIVDTTMATELVMHVADTIQETCIATDREHDQQLVAGHQLSR